MPPRDSEHSELHVYTSEDVDRMLREGAVGTPELPRARMDVKPAAKPQTLDYSTPRTPLRSRAVRITRVALLLAYPLLALLAYSVLSANDPKHPFSIFILLLFSPALVGFLIISCCSQFYLLSLFERKRMRARWNIPLSVIAGPVLGVLLLRVLGPLLYILLGKS